MFKPQLPIVFPPPALQLIYFEYALGCVDDEISIWGCGHIRGNHECRFSLARVPLELE